MKHAKPIKAAPDHQAADGPFYLRPTREGVAVCRDSLVPGHWIVVGNYADRDKAMYVKMFLNQQTLHEVPLTPEEAKSP